MLVSKKLEWRSAANIVAIVDLVRSILGVVIFGFVLVLCFQIEGDLVDRQQEIAQADDNSVENIGLKIFQIGIFAAMCFFEALVVFELCFAIGLLTASKVGTDTTKAFRISVIWILIQMLCIPFEGFCHLVCGFMVAWVLITFVRLAGIYVVFNYTKELIDVVKAADPEIKVSKSNVSIISKHKMSGVDNEKMKPKFCFDV